MVPFFHLLPSFQSFIVKISMFSSLCDSLFSMHLVTADYIPLVRILFGPILLLLRCLLRILHRKHSDYSHNNFLHSPWLFLLSDSERRFDCHDYLMKPFASPLCVVKMIKHEKKPAFMRAGYFWWLQQKRCNELLHLWEMILPLCHRSFQFSPALAGVLLYKMNVATFQFSPLRGERCYQLLFI